MAGNPFASSDPREAIRQEWIAAAPFWRKWYTQLSYQSRRATELVVNGAALAPGMHVLDLAVAPASLRSPSPSLSVRKAESSPPISSARCCRWPRKTPRPGVSATSNSKPRTPSSSHSRSPFRSRDLPLRHHVRSGHSQSSPGDARCAEAWRPGLVRHLGARRRKSSVRHDDPPVPQVCRSFQARAGFSPRLPFRR